MSCAHCGETGVKLSARGLCYVCYNTPAIRHAYPRQNGSTLRRGVGEGNGPRSLPAVATATRPGSEAKIAELERRAAAGLELWHPEDRGL
jgi:hypothetical protein